jgi:predicted  nucleic acid-binding Zn-ribbon protein
VADASERATLTAKLEQAEQRIAELEYSVRLLRGADETAESLAADLTRATQRVTELESVIRKASRAALPEPSHCPSALELTGQLLAVGLMLDRGLLPRSTDGK